MNSEFQIMRWGIPGWTFIMTVLLFKLAEDKYKIVNLMNSFDNPAVVAGIAAFFVALGVPLGYVVYQVYYAIKWRTMKTKTVLLSTEGIPDLEKLVCNKSGLELWYTIEGYFDRLMSIGTHGKKISYKDLVRRYNSFSNRTSRIHGLGASSLSILSGFGFYFFLTDNRSLLLDNNPFILTLISFVLCFAAVYINYCKQNKYSFVHMNQIMKDIIEAESEDDTSKVNKKVEYEEEEEVVEEKSKLIFQ